MSEWMSCVWVGVIATLVMDIWCLIRQPVFGVAFPDYGLVGRWFGHMGRGRFYHEAIGRSAPVRGEGGIGWFAHYAIGVAYAVLLVWLYGAGWLVEPTLLPAIGVGLATVVAPFFLMQPGMGAGVAASKTPQPNRARLHSVLTHAVFGCGLYVGGLAMAACEGAFSLA